MTEETKRILEIQRTYFSLLKDCFREQYSKVIQAKGNVKTGILDWATGKYEGEIQYNYTRRIEDIGHYWEQHDKELKRNITSLDLLPIYSVSRPMFLRKQLASAGLYCDVIIYHDESPAGLRNIGAISPNRRTDFVINALRDYMDLLLLEPYFTFDAEVPFVIACPGGRDFDENIEQNLIRKGKGLTLDYSNDLLDTKYSSWDELKENASTIIGSAAIKKAIKRPEHLPAPFSEAKDNSQKLAQCFERMRMLQHQSLAITPSKPILMDLFTSFLTEFAVMEGQLHGSLEIDSTPLLPRYTWDLYKWRISKGNIESSKLLGWEERRESVFATSLQHENLEWLSSLPLDAVVKLRNDGFLEDFRQKIRRSRKRLTYKDGLDFTGIAREISEEIESAILEHKETIKKLEREAHTRIGMETVKFLGKVWFKVASCWVPMLSLISSVADGVEFVTKIKEDKRVLDSLPDRFRRGPWGILLELKESNNNKIQE